MSSCPSHIQQKIEQIVGKNVSRETFSRLEKYLAFVIQENEKYNLIGPKEVDRLWERHVLDSAQLFPFVQNCGGFLDVGSGAGFPGVVLSVLGAAGGCLVESSHKKCSFLKNVSRETLSDFSVRCERVEQMRGVSFNRIVSRAVAPIERCLLWTRGVSSPNTQWFFLKGKTVEEEISVALKSFSFELDLFPSVTSEEGKVVRIQEVIFLGPL